MPRVPSALRQVVDTSDSDHDMESTSGRQKLPPVSNSTFESNNWHIDPAPQLPMLRKEFSEPILSQFVNRSASNIKCLPYPHTLDSYSHQPRPRSINTVSGTSYRFSIVTTGQEYKEYSYKKGADVVVQPSKVRGWFLKLGGKIKYSVGQIVASPSLILDGNRDIARGTARINMSRSQQQKSLHVTGDKLARKNRDAKRTQNDDSKARGSLEKADNDKSNEVRLSVVDIITAAENIAEEEIAQTASALSSRRASSEYHLALRIHTSGNSGDTETAVGSTGSISSSPADKQSDFSASLNNHPHASVLTKC
ncbi:hypothetical protein IWW36_002481 [Coemansia brasiliensis]|uniref:Uncharacterized protein n=1 Tax=Coemansia brasiliensis TaxID=2650707 RepID=A0A9W8IFT3_9FUNG|nr:hypothetical protein IWW36_002481 [Coemansia brasiliensis]